MPHHEAYFTNLQGLKLYQQWWLPAGDATAAVVIVHGVNEHSGRYAALADALNRHGYAAYTMDLRGHGQSEGPRAKIAAFDDYLDDLSLLIDEVADRQAGKPLFLFGHSMGGAIVTLFAIARQPDARGLVLSAPAVLVGGRVFPVLRHLAGLFSVLTPNLRLVRMGSRYISRDPQAVAEFQHDPLVFHGRFPVRTGAEILRAARRIQTNMKSLRYPLLIQHGTGDFVTDVEGSRRLHLGAASTDKTLHLYEGLYHCLLCEPEKEKVTADLLAWLDARR
jgi:acylglycerol lipase